jgi:hypothetical protein
LKNAEVPQLYRHVIGKAIGDMVQCSLDDIEDLVLYHAGLVADCHHDVALG